MRRLAIDIGGTFTDLVALDECTGSLTLEKTLTTPNDFALGVLDAIEWAGLSLPEVRQFVHGTTVVINALTERTGCRVALLTTRGFRDVLEIQRANRTDMYNLLYCKPQSFVPRRLRLEVRERVDWRGAVLENLCEEDVASAAEVCRRHGVEAIAVCFLHSYADVRHEQRARDLLSRLCPGTPICCSHELTQEWREYERANTTVLNAYVRPTADAYLQSLEEKLAERGFAGSSLAMQSNGGTASFARSRRMPIHLVESGPVGGVIGACAVVKQLGKASGIAFDMGGTTAKVSVIDHGEVAVRTDYHLERSQTWAGYPLKIPVIDIVEVGAGGGSIAWADKGGSLHVGPRSAGASPGPACYGLGGRLPTVTDANLLTGRLSADYFLGGRMTLDRECAVEAVGELARSIGLTCEQGAIGILRLVDANMQAALERATIERGYDPRDLTLVAYGGAGGLHAPILARQLHIRTIVIPNAPGQFSAWGMLMTDLRQDVVRTRVLACDEGTWPRIAAGLEDLGREALESFSPERHGGIVRTWIQQALDMRYVGQEHTVRTPVTRGEPASAVLERFHALHARAYAFRLDEGVEAVNFHATVWGEVAKPEMRAGVSGAGSLAEASKGDRDVLFEERGWLRTPVFERSRLPVGCAVRGPAIVEEPSSTTVVLHGQEVVCDELGHLIVSEGESQ